MNLQQRVVDRYAAAMSKRHQTILDTLKKGGYLEQDRRFYTLFDKSGDVVERALPANSILSMVSKGILIDDPRHTSPRRQILNPKWGQKRLRKKPGPPDGSAGFIQSGVLAGAYVHDDFKVTLTHAVWVDDRGEWLGDKTVCNKILQNRLAEYDGGDGPPTCKTCEARVRKYKLPRLKRFED